MRAYRVAEPGAAPELTEMDVPQPARGQVRVAIRACALNFADLLMIRGSYQDGPAPPFTPGMEVSGVVDALGEGVEGLRPGDRVAVFAGHGGLAEMGVFAAERVMRIPDAIGFEAAAAFQIAHGSAHVALDHRARLRPGETLLVTGAAGGAGLAAVQIGRLMGARVIAQARGADRLEVARAAGADHLIDSDADLRARVRALGGADVVYDTVGGATWQAAFRACRPEARLLPIGFASGEVPQIPANHLLVKNLTVIGFYVGGYLRFRPDVVRRSFATLTGWIAQGRLQPRIGHLLPLEKAGEGLDLLRNRQATGKVVIRP